MARSQIFQVDDESGHLVVISSSHSRIHRGEMFYFDVFEADIPDGASRVSVLRTGDPEVHLRTISISASEGPVIVTISENAVVTTLGVEVPLQNANRRSANASVAKYYDSTSVIANIGDPVLGNLYIPQNGNNGVTGDTGALEELVLKSNTDYTFTFTNDPAGSGDADVNAILTFYEVTEN